MQAYRDNFIKAMIAYFLIFGTKKRLRVTFIQGLRFQKYFSKVQ